MRAAAGRVTWPEPSSGTQRTAAPSRSAWTVREGGDPDPAMRKRRVRPRRPSPARHPSRDVPKAQAEIQKALPGTRSRVGDADRKADRFVCGSVSTGGFSFRRDYRATIPVTERALRVDPAASDDHRAQPGLVSNWNKTIAVDPRGRQAAAKPHLSC